MRTLLTLLNISYVLTARNQVYYYSLLNYTNFKHTFVENKCGMLSKVLSEWHFAPSKLHNLPKDEIKENYIRRNVKNAVFSEVTPTPLLTELKLVDYSSDVLVNILDMDPSVTETKDFLDFVAGNKVLDSSSPLAHRYGGYQFGSWASQLGDGRAILLGEYVNKKGDRWELQLKGAGKTPYSRDGDGRAVLRSSIREFLASEAMHYLDIPTSRAAAVIVSGDTVIRDPLYNGYVRKERAAVVLRVAPTWFRIGSLEILSRNNELTALKQLTDFIIQEHFTDINLADENKYFLFFSSVAEKTAFLVCKWLSVGFAHGVLNTDNISILGLTIDYGPFGFCEAYDPQMIPNHSDREGRYNFSGQLGVITWNLEKLSSALSPLLTDFQKQQIAGMIENFPVYSRQLLRPMLREKMGLRSDTDEDNLLVSLLLDMMEENGGDFIMTFRQLGEISLDNLMNENVLEESRYWSLNRIYQHDKYADFIDGYRRRCLEEDISEEERIERINKASPRYILRNWMAQSAIQKAENNDFSEVRFIQRVLRTPYTVNEDAENAGYSGPTPDWAHGLKVSCSS